jgi:hypothetical protein
MDDPENGHRPGQEGAKKYQRLNIAGHLVKQNLAAAVSAHCILLRQKSASEPTLSVSHCGSITGWKRCQNRSRLPKKPCGRGKTVAGTDGKRAFDGAFRTGSPAQQPDEMPLSCSVYGWEFEIWRF